MRRDREWARTKRGRPPRAEHTLSERVHFPAVLAISDEFASRSLTRSTRRSKSKCLARQTGLEPIPFWLTGNPVLSKTLRPGERLAEKLCVAWMIFVSVDRTGKVEHERPFHSVSV